LIAAVAGDEFVAAIADDRVAGDAAKIVSLPPVPPVIVSPGPPQIVSVPPLPPSTD